MIKSDRMMCEHCMHAAHWENHKTKVKFGTTEGTWKIHLVDGDALKALCGRGGKLRERQP